MAFIESIPISDHGSPGVCTSSYAVSYKRQSEEGYIPLPDQYTSPIVVGGLESGVAYDIMITRRCCNGSISDPSVVSVMETLPAPENLVATFDTGNDWIIAVDEVSAATNYILEVLGVTPEEVYNGDYAGLPGTHTITMDEGDVVGWRVKAQAPGYNDSEWTYYNIP